MNYSLSVKLQLSSFTLSASSQYVSFWRHKGRSWFLWWRIQSFYCWIFICYLSPFQNYIKLVCSLFQCWATECDGPSIQPSIQASNQRQVKIGLLRLCWAGAWPQLSNYMTLNHCLDQTLSPICKSPGSIFLVPSQNLTLRGWTDLNSNESLQESCMNNFNIQP